MKAPNKLIALFAQPRQMTAQQWRSGKIEAALPFLSQESIQGLLLLLLIEITPIGFLPRQRDFEVNDLHGCVAILLEGSAQNGMALQHSRPCGAEAGSVEWPLDATVQLLEIRATARPFVN